MPQTTFEPTDQGQSVVVDAVGDARIVHQISGQNEEGHSQKGKAVDARNHAVNDHQRGRTVVGKKINERGASHGNGHRDAAAHE